MSGAGYMTGLPPRPLTWAGPWSHGAGPARKRKSFRASWTPLSRVLSFLQTVGILPANPQPNPCGPQPAAAFGEADLNVRDRRGERAPPAMERGPTTPSSPRLGLSGRQTASHTRSIKRANTEEPPASQTLRLLLHLSILKSPGFLLFSFCRHLHVHFEAVRS